MIELFYSPTPNGRKVSIMLEETKIKYKEIEVVDEIIQKLYPMAVLDVNDEVLTIGKGYTKKKAEQEAAYNALVHYGIL